MALFNPADPLKAGHVVPATVPPTPNWRNNDQGDSGASDNGDAIVSGAVNSAMPNSYQAFPGTATIAIVGAPFNTAVTVVNDTTALLATPASGAGTSFDRVVGVFGRARPPTGLPGDPPPTRNIGVAGLSDVGGVGVYGITGSSPLSIPPPFSVDALELGIGVAGRALDGVQVEDEPLEVLFATSIGVLGTSTTGVGVRAHAGPLVEGEADSPTQGPPGPGAIFSAGLTTQVLPDPEARRGEFEIVSTNALPQLRLIPGRGNELPRVGHLGDLYAMATPADAVGSVPTHAHLTCRLFLCVQAGNGTTRQTGWAEIRQGAHVTVDFFH
jgi:hypothetical protein